MASAIPIGFAMPGQPRVRSLLPGIRAEKAKNEKGDSISIGFPGKVPWICDYEIAVPGKTEHSDEPGAGRARVVTVGGSGLSPALEELRDLATPRSCRIAFTRSLIPNGPPATRVKVTSALPFR